MAATHRTSAQWQHLVKQWQTSNQSAVQFCKERDIGYASFCNWRKRLTDNESQQESQGAVQFIDLGSLPSSTSSWNIVLSLGNGVELRLSQG